MLSPEQQAQWNLALLQPGPLVTLPIGLLREVAKLLPAEPTRPQCKTCENGLDCKDFGSVDASLDSPECLAYCPTEGL